jgi:3-oxoacyl-[acyl-carrier protein] reductase
MSITFNFVGRAAVVTGGAQGIGRAVVEKLIGGGASVAIWDRDKALAERTASELAERGKVVAVGVDVGDYASVERARDESVAALGKVDLLVNSAGIAGPIAKTWEHSPDQWDQVIRVNLTGPYHCCKALVPGMIESGLWADATLRRSPARRATPTPRPTRPQGQRHRPHQVARQGSPNTTSPSTPLPGRCKTRSSVR